MTQGEWGMGYLFSHAIYLTPKRQWPPEHRSPLSAILDPINPPSLIHILLIFYA